MPANKPASVVESDIQVTDISLNLSLIFLVIAETFGILFVTSSVIVFSFWSDTVLISSLKSPEFLVIAKHTFVFKLLAILGSLVKSFPLNHLSLILILGFALIACLLLFLC